MTKKDNMINTLLKKDRTLVSFCTTIGYEELQCGFNCSATLCMEIIPDYISDEQVLKYVKVLLAKELQKEII
jgi:hypothetical protein